MQLVDRRRSVPLLLAFAIAALTPAAACRSSSSVPAPHPPAMETPAWSGPRLVAIGDLHGDLAAARAALRLAGAIDAADRWIGNDLVVVQTGDLIDRGDDDRALIELLERLRKEAEPKGGRVVALVGNHEAINVEGDFQYASSAAIAAFAEYAANAGDAPPHIAAAARGRWAAFRPGGPIASLFATHDVVAVIGDTVLVHGGVLPGHVEYGLGRMNAELAAWLRGDAPAPAAVLGRGGPLWTRLLAEDRDPDLCTTLDDALALIPARRMVVGHTIQKQGITSACGERLWRIDTGMTAFYGGPIEVLELGPGGARVLRAAAPVDR
jgi:hypothetical protein